MSCGFSAILSAIFYFFFEYTKSLYHVSFNVFICLSFNSHACWQMIASVVHQTFKHFHQVENHENGAVKKKC